MEWNGFVYDCIYEWWYGDTENNRTNRRGNALHNPTNEHTFATIKNAQKSPFQCDGFSWTCVLHSCEYISSTCVAPKVSHRCQNTTWAKAATISLRYGRLVSSLSLRKRQTAVLDRFPSKWIQFIFSCSYPTFLCIRQTAMGFSIFIKNKTYSDISHAN